jgi:hypothetical protein
MKARSYTILEAPSTLGLAGAGAAGSGDRRPQCRTAKDDAVMPAVDFRVPGSLSPDELKTVLRMALETGRAVGLDVAIYNPDLDPEGSAGRALADALNGALRAGTSPRPAALA